MSEGLINQTHPVTMDLEAAGFGITMHAFLRDGVTSVAFTAHSKEQKRTFTVVLELATVKKLLATWLEMLGLTWRTS